MSARDESLPVDSRFYQFRNYQSVFPMPEWGTLKEWNRSRKKIKQHLWLCTGMNDRTAAFRPKAKVVSRFEHEGVIIENIRLETLPGLYVMGNLYRPKGAKGKLPLVLHPHGHGMRSRTVGRGNASVPHRAMNHALNGFVSFAWSMIAHDNDMMQIEHRTLLRGAEKEVSNLLGLSIFGVQLHNGMKVIDYLSRRKEIDANRIGCTGESGGATQTYYLAGLDDRIKVAAPAVMLSGHYQGGCVCENAPNLHLDYSTLHYAALIAPRPMLITGCSGDWTHHMRDRELTSMKELYRLYDREDAIDGFFQDEIHNYNRPSRERVYAWMDRWLKGGDPSRKRIAESTKPVPEPEQLLVHDTPVPPVKPVIRSIRSLTSTWTTFSKPDSVDDMRSILNLDLPARPDLLVRNRTPKYASKGKRLFANRIDYGRFSEDSQLTCRFVLPEKGRPTHLVLSPWKGNGWDRFVSEPPSAIQKLIDAGDGVIVPALLGQRGSSEVLSHRKGLEDSYLFTSYNRTTHAYQAADIVTTVRLAQIEMGIAPTDIRIVADKGIALLAFIAWSALRDQKSVGTFAGDFTGIDLEKPKHWARHAYLPLVLRGGVQSLLKLVGRGKGLAGGVTRSDVKSYPKGFRVRQKSLSLDDLLSSQ